MKAENFTKAKGVNAEKVRSEIQITIDMGMVSQDPDVQMHWENIQKMALRQRKVISFILRVTLRC